jgi:hypothetical protein
MPVMAYLALCDNRFRRRIRPAATRRSPVIDGEYTVTAFERIWAEHAGGPCALKEWGEQRVTTMTPGQPESSWSITDVSTVCSASGAGHLEVKA